MGCSSSREYRAPPSPGCSRPWESHLGVVLSLHPHSRLEIPGDVVPASFLLEKWDLHQEWEAMGLGNEERGIIPEDMR